MKRRELLGVMLKAIGFWSLVGGISGLPQAISFSHEYPDEQEFMLMMADTFAAPSILIVTGWFLIRATNWFIDIAGAKANSTGDENAGESSREILGVVLIALGYGEILNGVVRLPYEIARVYRANVWSFDGIAYSGCAILAGCFLLFATDWCVQFAYKTPAIVGDDVTDDGASV